MSAVRASVAQFALAARGEARLAFARVPGILQRALMVTAWAALAIFLGTFVGFAAVLLPPMGAFAIVAVVAVVLLWVMPDLAYVPDRIVRRLLFVSLAVNIAVPLYYAVLIPGLPFVSARRMILFPLVSLFAIAISGSSEVRRSVADMFRSNRLISIGLIGYFIMVCLSILTSINPPASLDTMTTLILESYLPLLAILYVIRKESDVDLLIHMVCWCALIVFFMGLVEFFVHFNVYLRVLPKSMLAALAANNPYFAGLIEGGGEFRNGMFRATSVFVTPLSFAEFGAMISPFGLMFLFHAKTTRDRAFGAALLVAAFLGIFVSGSRGGYMAFFAALVALFAAWLVRTRRFAPQSMAATIGLVVGTGAIIGAVLIVMFVGRAHHIVLGGGMEAYSDESRHEEWRMAIPRIIQSPITGLGYGLGGDIVGYHTPGALVPTLDSFLISTLVETGIPSLVFFFGMIVAAIWRGFRRYIFDSSWCGALAGGLAAALVAYIVYRTVLTQRENQSLFYLFIGSLMVMDYCYSKSDGGGAKGKAAADGGRSFGPARPPKMLRGQTSG